MGVASIETRRYDMGRGARAISVILSADKYIFSFFFCGRIAYGSTVHHPRGTGKWLWEIQPPLTRTSRECLLLRAHEMGPSKAGTAQVRVVVTRQICIQITETCRSHPFNVKLRR